MLKNLKIYSTNGDIKNLLITKLIRNVSFKKGLNLIIDSDDVTGKGNDIGKTTFINLIDLCFGARDIDIIYSDKETKTSKNNPNIVQRFIENISYFNQIFHKFQEEVYGEASTFIYSDSERGFKLSTDKSKSGSGQKKGEVILFDLAYNKLATDKKIKSPKFIIHDQLELTDITPKEEVFVKILPQLDCQFIVPSIRSSLTVLGEDFIKENTILELSKTNKLFRIEEYDSIEKYKY